MSNEESIARDGRAMDSNGQRSRAAFQAVNPVLTSKFIMERVTRIELAFSAWESETA
jgi:hypothetical protein